MQGAETGTDCLRQAAPLRAGESTSPHLPGRASERAISMMSSRPAVGSSLFQATPSPMRKSTPLTLRSSKLRFGAHFAKAGQGFR